MKISRYKGWIVLNLLAFAIFFSGCQSPQGFSSKNSTQVDLAKKNYKVVKANAIGKSYGFWFLGIIPFATTSYTEAISDLYEKAGGVQEGKSQAFVNTAEERSFTYLILFTITKLTVRADIVEFTE